MTTRPLVSVLIPATRARWVAGAVRSALAQTDLPIEVVLCDDDPGPGVAAATEPFIGEPRFRYLRNTPPRGLSGTYRRLVEEASGRWGKFLDDDDELIPGKLVPLVEAAERPPKAALVHAWGEVVAVEGPAQRSQPPRLAARTRGVDFFLRFDKVTPLSPTVLFDIDLARRCEIYDVPDGPSTSDWDAWLRMSLHGEVAFVPERVVIHRLHGTSVSSSLTLEQRLAAVTFLDSPLERAARVGAFPPKVLASWQRRMLTWQLISVLSEYLGSYERRVVARTIGDFWRRRPAAVVAAFGRPKVLAMLLLSVSPRCYRGVRRAWRATVRHRPVG